MIKSKSYEITIENIEIIINNWGQQDFPSISKDYWGIFKEGKEAYYINNLKEQSENGEKNNSITNIN